MQQWLYILGWSVEVLFISAALSLWEILMEKDKGWGSALNEGGWGRRMFAGSLLARLCEKQYLTLYHVVMFGAIIPGILLAQCLYLQVHASGSGFAVLRLGSVQFVPGLSIAAAWLAICTVEDFLWFALNWYYPGSLKDLFSGEIAWHTRWVNLGGVKLPRFYVVGSLLSLCLLAASILCLR